MVKKTAPKQRPSAVTADIAVERQHCFYCKKSDADVPLKESSLDKNIVSCSECENTMVTVWNANIDKWLDITETNIIGNQLHVDLRYKPAAVSDADLFDMLIKRMQEKQPDTLTSVKKLSIRPYPGSGILSPHLAGISFSRFPESILKFKNLESLNISFCKLPSIPDSIVELKKLRVLEVTYNSTPMHVSDGICKLQALEKLNLAGAGIDALPERIGDLKGLTELNISYNGLSYNGKLESLPDSICDLGNLIRLDANNCSIRKMPKNIGCLKNLESLELKSNRISKLPKSIGNLSKLTLLNLHSNDLGSGLLGSISGSICKLTNLQKLYLDWNLLKRLPKSMGDLKNLGELYLNNNRLKSIPESMLKLTEMKEFEAGNDAYVRNHEGVNKNALDPASAVRCALLGANTGVHRMLVWMGADAFFAKYPGLSDLRRRTLKRKRASMKLNKEQFSELVMEHPDILDVHVETMSKTRNYFKSLSAEQFWSLLMDHPNVLKASPKELEKRKAHLGLETGTFFELILKSPWITTCSWEWFIETEPNFLEEAGIAPSS